MEFNNDMERLAVAQALYKVLGEIVSTKDHDSLRGKCDRAYKELYDTTGAKSFDLILGGVKVGRYSISFTSEKESRIETSFVVTDHEQLARWFESIEVDLVTEFAAMNLGDFAKFVFERTGEIPDGTKLEEVVIPAVPSAYKGGSIRVEPELVAQAISNQLPDVAGLLFGEVV